MDWQSLVNYPSTTLRVVPLPTLRGRRMQGWRHSPRPATSRAMPGLLLVMLGGASAPGCAGSRALALARLGPGFPWGTLVVNLRRPPDGLLAGALGEAPANRPLWLLLAVGLLGGFTTFSAFSFDLFAMLQRGRSGTARSMRSPRCSVPCSFFALGWWAARAAA